MEKKPSEIKLNKIEITTDLVVIKCDERASVYSFGCRENIVPGVVVETCAKTGETNV